jgi:Family of unknown function (DUF6529)
MIATIEQPPRAGRLKVLFPLLAGAAVSIALGVYGNVHDPAGKGAIDLAFIRTVVLKVYLASAAAVIALFQLATALRLYGKISFPRVVPSWLGMLHRVTGTVAFVLVVIVAYHCLWALGFQRYEPRLLFHSILGCFFFGAFTAKVIVVQSKNLPGWWLPLAGGSLFTALVLLWLSSAGWFFVTFGFQYF